MERSGQAGRADVPRLPSPGRGGWCHSGPGVGGCRSSRRPCVGASTFVESEHVAEYATAMGQMHPADRAGRQALRRRCRSTRPSPRSSRSWTTHHHTAQPLHAGRAAQPTRSRVHARRSTMATPARQAPVGQRETKDDQGLRQRASALRSRRWRLARGRATKAATIRPSGAEQGDQIHQAGQATQAASATSATSAT